MRTLEEQIELVATEALRAANEPALRQRLRGWWAMSAVAASAVLLLGSVQLLRSGAEEGYSTATSPAAQPPTVTYPDERWLIAKWLPDGYAFDVATTDTFMGRTVQYASDDGQAVITVRQDSLLVQGLDEAEAIDLDGDKWSVSTVKLDDGEVVLREAFRVTGTLDEAGAVGTVVSGPLDTSQLTELLRGLEEGPASRLPRPPLPLTPEPDAAPAVARAEVDGRTAVLHAVTDGVWYSMTLGDGGGAGPTRLRAGEAIAVAGALGPTPPVDPKIEEHSVLWGLVRGDVASVDAVLADGRTISVAPQDEHGFDPNFFLIAVPTRTEGGMELLTALVARDAAGNELGRNTNPF